MGRTMAFCELCTRAHFFCFHPKIAVPCTILTLGPETSRCLRRPRWAVLWCSVNFSKKTFFFQFFFLVFCELVPVEWLRFAGPDCEQKVQFLVVVWGVSDGPGYGVLSTLYTRSLLLFFIEKSPYYGLVARGLPLKVGASKVTFGPSVLLVHRYPHTTKNLLHALTLFFYLLKC